MTALLVIDMQIGLFSDGSRFDADGVVSRINALARAVRASDGCVIFIQHEDDGDLIRGGEGWQLLPSLERDPRDATVEKAACDSFYRSDLERVLRERAVEQLLITGCATDFCVDTTIRSAASKDYDLVVASDGHTTRDRAHLDAKTIIAHHNWMWARLILPGHPVRVLPTAEIVASL